MSDLASAATAWMDRWWDPEAGLLWNMDGSFDEVAPARSIHLVPQSAWYAAALLLRGAAGDEPRAVQTIEALLATQYDEPGTEWHGTFARFLESPRPQTGARMWVDFDPNWRQFIGTTWQLLLQDGQAGSGLDASLQRRMRDAIALAVAGEPPDRVPPTYSNIALMRAWLEVEHDRPGAQEYAAQVVVAFDAHGAFEEYNSATYYGIDLYALALWRHHSSSPALRADGARIEAALWTDVARWYHPGLRNLCGPWSRSYGMDMTRYASLLGLWMWSALGRPAAPFPDIDAPFEHSHDLSLGPLIDHLGARVPRDVSLDQFAGEHTVEQVISSVPSRVATGWLADSVMAGGEAGDLGVSARGQYHPATVHWALPDGGVGWIRLVHYAPASAVASVGRLDVACRPHARRGPQAPTLEVYAPGASIAGRSWKVPGLVVDVSVDPESVEPRGDGVTVARFPVGTASLSLDLR